MATWSPPKKTILGMSAFAATAARSDAARRASVLVPAVPSWLGTVLSPVTLSPKGLGFCGEERGAVFSVPPIAAKFLEGAIAAPNTQPPTLSSRVGAAIATLPSSMLLPPSPASPMLISRGGRASSPPTAAFSPDDGRGLSVSTSTSDANAADDAAAALHSAAEAAVEQRSDVPIETFVSSSNDLPPNGALLEKKRSCAANAHNEVVGHAVDVVAVAPPRTRPLLPSDNFRIALVGR